jgi:putative hemolysin
MSQVNEEKILQIDLDNILRKKSGKRKVPKFIVAILKKIVHQKEGNEFLRKHNGKIGVDWSKAFLKDFNIKIKTTGEENIPKDGRFIFAANHPLGGTESHVFIKIVSDHFPDIKFPVNDILMEITPLHPIFIPVNKFGGQKKENIQLFNDTLASNAQILIFPAGLCSRKIKGEIIDLKWKKTFISKAIEYKRDIIPVFIEGRNSNFFYNLANLRKFLGIKFNIEMLFLVNEVYKQKNRTISLHFGKPISYTKFDKSKSHTKWAKFVKDEVYKIKSNKS